MVEDLNTSNGTYLILIDGNIQSGQKVAVSKDEIIQIGEVRLQLL